MLESSAPPAAEPEWAAFVAIDWADQKNFWRLLPAGSQRSEEGELEYTPEAVETWAAGLQQRFGGGPIAVCLEQSRGALVYMLTKYPHLVLFPVHPTTAARYRETFAPSGAKSDPSDTALLLDLLLRHRERLRRLQPDTPETRLLHFLVEERRQTVDDKTRESNRLTGCLKLYFPQILQWFDDVTSPLVGDLLERWPNLQQLQRAHPGTLRKFFPSTTAAPKISSNNASPASTKLSPLPKTRHCWKRGQPSPVGWPHGWRRCGAILPFWISASRNWSPPTPTVRYSRLCRGLGRCWFPA